MTPYKHKFGQTITTDVPKISADRGFISHLQVAADDAVAASDDGVHAAITLANGQVTNVTTAITNPKVPRALRVKGNAAGIAGNVVIEGTNYLDEAFTETIVAADATAVDGTKAFKTITKITVPARTAAGDTISIGFCDVLGLPYKFVHDTVVLAAVDNVREATAPTVTVSATAIEGNTVKTNTALSGKVVDVYLIV